MQTQHLFIIAGGQLVGLVLLTYFIRKAFLRALARATADSRDRINALNNDKTQVRMVGNSVSPQPMAAPIRANMDGAIEHMEVAA